MSVVVALVGATGYASWDRLITLIGASADPDGLDFLTVAVVKQPEISPVLTATGKIVSDHQVHVATKVSGQVVGLYFEQGDHVQQGQIMAAIEDVLYRARRDETAARLARSRARLRFEKVNYERIAKLAEMGNAPPIEYANAKRALEEAQAQVAADQAALDFSQKALDDCEVVAPITGVILERNVEVGDFVAAEGGLGANANARFASIADMKTLRVEVDISELDIARITRGLHCIISPDAYKDRRYYGHVLWIDPGANYSKATVQVKVRIQNPDEYLRVEGSAQVVFLSAQPSAGTGEKERPPSIWIPRSACLFDPSGQTAKVFTLVDGRLRATAITIGRRSSTQVEVTTGLTAGQSIVADGVAKLTDGQIVRKK